MNDRFWAKVLFKEFIRHYRKLDDAQIVGDVRKSMDDLEDLVDDADSFGSKMVRWSMERVDARPAEASRENGKKGGRPKKIPQDAPNGNAGVDMSDAGNGAASKSPTSCDQFTADGDIREDSQAKPDGSAISRNETRAHDALEPSANIYGDAATREGAEAFIGRESGAYAPTTVSRNMRRVPQNEAPAHGFSGGRTAQGTMSPSPSGAAQDGKFRGSAKTQGESNTGSTVPAVCPESGDISEARQSRRTDGQRVGNVARPPVRSPGRNSRCPNSREEFHAFVADNNLHENLAEEWYAMHEARGWVDKNGTPIKDWRGALYNYCTKTEQKRRTA